MTKVKFNPESADYIKFTDVSLSVIKLYRQAFDKGKVTKALQAKIDSLEAVRSALKRKLKL